LYFSDEGTIVGIVIACMVAVLLIGAVLLLTCSHLRMPEGDDISIEDRTISKFSPTVKFTNQIKIRPLLAYRA
jgi:hypothetical protein